MFKFIVFCALIAVAVAVAKPGILHSSYVAPALAHYDAPLHAHYTAYPYYRAAYHGFPYAAYHADYHHYF